MESLFFGNTQVDLYWNDDLTNARIESKNCKGSLQRCTGDIYSVFLEGYKGSRESSAYSKLNDRGNIGRAKSQDLKDAILKAMKMVNSSWFKNTGSYKAKHSIS